MDVSPDLEVRQILVMIKQAFVALFVRSTQGILLNIDTLIRYLDNYFEPWPEWVVLCKKSLNFVNDWELKDRKESFKRLMEMPYGINTLLEDEKVRLMSEYLTIFTNAQDLLKKSTKLKIEELWYVLLTEEKYYKNCQLVNHFILQFFTRSFNECIVETEVSNVEGILTSERPLHDKNAEMLNFISSNGPDPLVSIKVVEDMMSKRFGKDWHFTLANSRWFVSKVVDRHFDMAKNSTNSLA